MMDRWSRTNAVRFQIVLAVSIWGVAIWLWYS